MQAFRWWPQGAEVRGSKIKKGKKEEKIEVCIIPIVGMNSGSWNTQEPHEKCIDHLLRRLLKELQTEGLIYLLLPPVVSSCPQECNFLLLWAMHACGLRELPQHLWHQSHFRAGSNVSTWGSHWQWSDLRPTQTSTQCVAKLRREAERKWGRTTVVNPLHCSSLSLHAQYSNYCLQAFGQVSSYYLCTRYIYQSSWNKLRFLLLQLIPSHSWYLSSLSSSIHSSFSSFSISDGIVCLPWGWREGGVCGLLRLSTLGDLSP